MVKDKSKSKSLSSELTHTSSNIYGFIIIVFNIIIALYDRKIGIIAFFVVFIYFIYNYRINIRQRKKLVEYIENLTLNIDSASKDTLLKFPLPMMIAEYTGEIVWYNQKFASIINGQKLIGKNYNDFLPDLSQAILSKINKISNVEFENKFYDVYITIVEIDGYKNEKRFLNLFYFVDVTDHKMLLDRIRLQNIVFGYLHVDNYDDVLNSTPEVYRTNIASDIEKRIYDWFYNQIKSDIFISKFEKDKFMIISNFETLEKMKEKRFNIIDQLKEINIYNRIIPTISFGIGIRNTSISQASKDAKMAVDMALSRGGDQVVINDSGNYEFFGGKSKEIEKRSKVRSRVMAQTIKEIIKHADKIFIIGHQLFDFDCLAAAIGITVFARSMDKEVNIVTKRINPSIEEFIKKLKEDEKYKKVFISFDEVDKRRTQNSVLFVVDTQRPSYLDIPEMISNFDKIVVIDHHRRAVDWIENALISWTETYASSTSELIAEILNYEGIRLSKLEADLMMAGIMVDTKGFIKNTGVRTFEVATFLRENGAEPQYIKEFLKEDFETYLIKQKLIENTEIINGNIAIAVDNMNLCENNVIIAKVADELLNIKGIDASFVLCSSQDGILISARSNGSINVQLILEKLGGGGHLDTAGAKLINVSFEEAIEILKNAISQYISQV